MNRNLSLRDRLRLQQEGQVAPARPPVSPSVPAAPVPAAQQERTAEELGLSPYTMANRPQMAPLPQQPLPQNEISAMAPPAPTRPRSQDPVTQARNEAIYGVGSDTGIATTPKRGFWDVLKTAGVGALQGMASGGGLGGAIGGAVAGGLTSAIDPAAGRGYRFDMMQRPRLEADMARRMTYDKFAREQMRGQAELEQTIAQTGKTRAETEAIPGREQLTREAAQARIGRERAQTEKLQRPVQPRRTPEEEQRATEMHQARLGLVQAQTQKARRPSSGGSGGAGEGTSAPAALTAAFNRAVQAKLAAEEAWATANSDPSDTESRALAEAALRAYNALAEQLGRAYPQTFEVGQGNGGWNYIKQRGR